jgi:cytochrome c oxidase subunit 3
MEQQREAGSLGMWIFLVTEIMFFGGLFFSYALYRSAYPDAFSIASNTLDWRLGAINTVVLIVSSLTMALAVHSAQVGNRQLQVLFLICTMIFGLAFLGIKSVEYHQKYVEQHVPGTLIPRVPFHWDTEHEPLPANVQPRNVEMFFWIYFAMTGLHALHMIIGVGVLSVILYFAWKGRYTPEYHAPVEVSGLYWHFVDIVWIFLFPLLYLLGRHLEHAR